MRKLTEETNALKIRQPVDFVGTSQGGAIAFYFTAHHPEKVRKLALFAPPFDSIPGEGMIKLVRLPCIGIACAS